MRHEPRQCSQQDADDPPEDNHSGSRLVLLLMIVPLSVFAGWIGYSVVRELGRERADPVTAQRLAFVAGGLAMLAMTLAILKWQSALSPRAQATAEEEIDEMDESEDGPDNY